MSHSAAGVRTGQRNMRTYALQVANAIDLTKTRLRDTVILDDTGATLDVVVSLPKIGTAFAPIGLRSTFKKMSNVAHAISLDPALIDGLQQGSAAFPGIGAAGVASNAMLPPSVPNSVTLEATNMALTGSVGATQPNPAGGTPTTAGAWITIDGVPNGGAPASAAFGFLSSLGAQAILVEAPIVFGGGGATVLGDGVTHPSSSTLVVRDAGTYLVEWNASPTEASELALFVNGVFSPGTAFTAVALGQNIGQVVIALAAGASLSINNHTSTAGTINLAATTAGGTVANTNATFYVRRLS